MNTDETWILCLKNYIVQAFRFCGNIHAMPSSGDKKHISAGMVLNSSLMFCLNSKVWEFLMQTLFLRYPHKSLMG